MNNSISILWTMFKLERQSNGIYRTFYDFDETWLNRQISKLQAEKGRVIFVVADLFCELVYDITFVNSDVVNFSKKVEKKLRKVNPSVRCLSERNLVTEVWSLQDYIKEYQTLLELNVKKLPALSEIERRKIIYNTNGYQISDDQLKLYAQRAEALFAVQRLLVKKII